MILSALCRCIILPYLQTLPSFIVTTGYETEYEKLGDGRVIRKIKETPTGKYEFNEFNEELTAAFQRDAEARRARQLVLNRMHGKGNYFPDSVAANIGSFLGLTKDSHIMHRLHPVPASLRSDWEDVRQRGLTAAASAAGPSSAAAPSAAAAYFDDLDEVESSYAAAAAPSAAAAYFGEEESDDENPSATKKQKHGHGGGRRRKASKSRRRSSIKRKQKKSRTKSKRKYKSKY
jgi:hypothetical protein